MVFKGTIIEESLEGKSVLKELKIIGTEIERVTKEHKTPWLKQWTLHKVEIADDKAQGIADKISTSLDKNHNWYADFKSENKHYIIFKNKVFFVNRTLEEYKKVKEYGLKLGIPSYQLDFSPEIKNGISLKIHTSYRIVVGICDLDLIGKKFEEGKRQLDCRANFYEDRKLEFKEAVEIIKRQSYEDATFNIVGKESIKASIEAGIIQKEDVDKIQGIPFALTLI